MTTAAAKSVGHDARPLVMGFHAFGYPNYRLWFGGQIVSLIGTWMHMTAQGFLVFELTKSPAYLGYVGFAAGVPAWIFMLYGGVLCDRIGKRNLLLATQSCMMLAAAALALLCFSGAVRPHHILAISFAMGTANAFDAPARQSLVLDLVTRKDLANAIALNGAIFNTASIIGPAIGGVVYASLGPAWCFSINSATFLAVILALAMMKLTAVPRLPAGTSVLRELRDGLRYAFSHKIIRALIFTTAIVSIFGLALSTLMPAWAVNVLRGDARTNGWIQSARGVGALAAALMIASMGRFRFKGRLLCAGLLTFPVFLVAFSFSRRLPLSLLLLVGVGWGIVTAFNMLNVLIQTLVEDGFRGRVMSIHSLVFFGFLPLSALLIGATAEFMGEPRTVLVAATICFIFALWLTAARPQLRRLE